MTQIPVILLCYKRHELTARVIEALRQLQVNRLYIFCDGPKSEKDVADVMLTRRLVESITWTKPEIIFRSENLGLAKSVLAAVASVFQFHDRLVVFEDDCVPKPHFFTFMERCLDLYESNERVLGVSGYTPEIPRSILNSYPFDAYFFPRMHSWGWGMWKRAWKLYNPDLLDMKRQCLDNLIDLNQGGTDVPLMVDQYLNARLTDAWTLQWVLQVYLQKAYYVYPTESHVANIGFDGTGVHCADSYHHLSRSSQQLPERFPQHVFTDPALFKNYRVHYDHQLSTHFEYMQDLVSKLSEQIEKGEYLGAYYTSTHIRNLRTDIEGVDAARALALMMLGDLDLAFQAASAEKKLFPNNLYAQKILDQLRSLGYAG